MGTTFDTRVSCRHAILGFAMESVAITPGMSVPMIKDQGGESSHANVIQKNELNTLMGVYIPCMLSILGAILFLRLSWAVGQTGYLGVLGIFAIAGSAVLLTALSISAISTNGSMGGGGAYFMISRSLGPEFGGAVGIIFYFANAVGATFHLVAFADNVVDTFWPDTSPWLRVLVASIALFMTLIGAWIGASFFSKLNAVILALIAVSVISAILSLSFGDAFGCTAEHENGISGFTGFNLTTFTNNLTPNYGGIRDDPADEPSTTEFYTFFRVFTIIFPALTGIMAGANLSGDLKDPGRSIGTGTIYAILSSAAVYLILGFLVTWTIEFEYLQDNVQAIQNISCWPSGKYFIMLGIVCSTLSSALGQLTGAARVLQAFCKDFSEIGENNAVFGNKRLVKVLRFFSYGSPGKNEPRYAVILTWAIAQSVLLLRRLDLLASIMTNCFLLTYFFTNFACFVLKVTGAPNFRPRFRYFSWHTALLGAVLNIVIMFLSSWIFASISIVLLSIVFFGIVYASPQVPWGDVSQALIYHQVRKYLLRLDERKNHVKYWRPSILLIVDEPMQSMGLIDFCNNLKKGGLYVIGDVLVGNLRSIGDRCSQLQDQWTHLIPEINVKAFSEVSVAETFRSGCQTLMISAGLGGMRPNTVVLPFLMDHSQGPTLVRQNSVSTGAFETLQEVERIHNRETRRTAEEFVDIVRDVLFLNKNLLVARDFHLLDKDLIVSQVSKKSQQEQVYIDIWFTDELEADDLLSYSGGLSLMMQLAHGLNRTDIWQECSTIRIVHLLRKQMDEHVSDEMLQYHREQLQLLLIDSRVKAESEVLVMRLKEEEDVNHTTNTFLQQNTTQSAVIFLNLPVPPPEDQDTQADIKYVDGLTTLTNNLPPTILALAGQRLTVIATEI